MPKKRISRTPVELPENAGASRRPVARTSPDIPASEDDVENAGPATDEDMEKPAEENDEINHAPSKKAGDFDRKTDSAQKETKKPGLKKYLTGTFRDILVSVITVIVVLTVLYAYSGVWPPMVVIESSSMMHGTDSQIGVIDTGDLTLVKKIGDRDEIITYLEATSKTNPHYNHKTYGDYGDVIIYKKNGLAETPVIHRAVAWVEYNSTASNPPAGIFKGDIPDIGVYNVSEYTITHMGYQDQTVTIHFRTIFSAVYTSPVPHGGFLTKGDHNLPAVDQEVLTVRDGHRVEPIRTEWVVGRSDGELPWFGIFKLWVSGHKPEVFPKTSVNGLIAVIILLVVVPIVLDYAYDWMKKGKESRSDIRKRIKESKLKNV